MARWSQSELHMKLARPTIVSRHLINFDLGKRFTQEGVYKPFLY